MEIILLAKETGLDAIEWGGDIHVPTGLMEIAKDVGRMTREAGLTVEAYGSYYRAGVGDPALNIESVLDTAAALGAPRVRIWPGNLSSATVGTELREKIVADITQCARFANDRDITIALEFHGNTLTDSTESTLLLMREINDPSVRLYWQPPNGMPSALALRGLEQLLPWIDHVHVFQWQIQEGRIARRPLEEGQSVWQQYLAALKNKPSSRWALLEFVQNDDPHQFRADAAVLRDWLTNRA